MERSPFEVYATHGCVISNNLLVSNTNFTAYAFKIHSKKVEVSDNIVKGNFRYIFHIRDASYVNIANNIIDQIYPSYGYFVSAGGDLESISIHDNNVHYYAHLNCFVDDGLGNVSDFFVEDNKFLSSIGNLYVNSAFEDVVVFKRNIGYRTENSGNATISNGSSSVTISHGLVQTPTHVLLTGTDSEVSNCWVTNVTDTQFTINVPSAVTADRYVFWEAEV